MKLLFLIGIVMITIPAWSGVWNGSSMIGVILVGISLTRLVGQYLREN
jgi:hypothetical protein